MAAAAVLAVGGGAVALLQPGLKDGRLTQAGREVFEAVARGVLEGSLPSEAEPRRAALSAHLHRLDDTVSAFPQHIQSELSQLLGLLATSPGRATLAGLPVAWPDASPAEIQAALQAMRLSGLTLRQQAYQALRDLTNAAYFADASAWAALGYPGPRAT